MKNELELDYTKPEVEELKKLIDFTSPMSAVSTIVRQQDRFPNLSRKYNRIIEDEELNFMNDIAHIVRLSYVFPEEPLYIVVDNITDEAIHDDDRRGYYWDSVIDIMPAKKTKEEWLDINPAYEQMLEKVEE